jgi:hypothetical protein
MAINIVSGTDDEDQTKSGRASSNNGHVGSFNGHDSFNGDDPFNGDDSFFQASKNE